MTFMINEPRILRTIAFALEGYWEVTFDASDLDAESVDELKDLIAAMGSIGAYDEMQSASTQLIDALTRKIGG